MTQNAHCVASRAVRKFPREPEKSSEIPKFVSVGRGSGGRCRVLRRPLCSLRTAARSVWSISTPAALALSKVLWLWLGYDRSHPHLGLAHPGHRLVRAPADAPLGQLELGWFSGAAAGRAAAAALDRRRQRHGVRSCWCSCVPRALKSARAAAGAAPSARPGFAGPRTRITAPRASAA
jgi:hypothetical protein